MKRFLSSVLVPLLVVSSVYAQTEYEADFSQDSIHKSPNIEVVVGPGTYYNSYYGNSWVMHYSGGSFIDFIFDKHENDTEKAFLEITHLSSLVNGEPNSPVSIYINDKPYLTHYDPHNGNWVHDVFDITGWVQNGTNVVRIHFDKEATTNYWIHNLKIVVGE